MPGFDAFDEVLDYPETASGGLSIAYLSAYPPRECGLATYCEDLLTATLTAPAVGEPIVIAMEDRAHHYDYPWPVVGTVEDREESEYEAAAQFINESPAGIVSIQHESGIFGGPQCRGLCRFLEDVTKPIVTTFHAVLPSPSPSERAMIGKLARRSDRVVVFNGLAEAVLQREYRLGRTKIALVHHGRRMLWPTVGARYVKVFGDVLREQQANEPEAAYARTSAECEYIAPRGIQ